MESLTTTAEGWAIMQLDRSGETLCLAFCLDIETAGVLARRVASKLDLVRNTDFELWYYESMIDPDEEAVWVQHVLPWILTEP